MWEMVHWARGVVPDWFSVDEAPAGLTFLNKAIHQEPADGEGMGGGGRPGLAAPPVQSLICEP